MAQYEVTLRDYWRILRRRRGIVLFTAVVLSFFSFLASSVWQPLPIYKAESKVQINTTRSALGGYFQTLSYGDNDIETQQAIITSYKVLERVAHELHLFGFAVTAEDTARVVMSLMGRIQTRQEGYTNIIAVQATDSHPTMARDLTNTVAGVFRDYDRELKNQQNVNHRGFVEGQRRDARQKLQDAEEAVRLYREESQLISLIAQTSVTLQLITQSERLSQQLEQDLSGIDAMLEEMASERELSEEFMGGASRARVGPTFMGLSQQLNGVRLERDALLVQYTERHPKVQQIEVKIAQLGNGLREELIQRRQSMMLDLEGEKRRLTSLRRDYNELPSSGLALSRLEREVGLRQQVVTALEEQYQAALSREADMIEEVTILQWAITPGSPTNPHPKLRRAVMGFVLGMLLGIVFAVVAETLDTSIGTIEDVQEYIGTQVVGVIPFIDVEQVRSSLERRGMEAGDDRTVQRKAQLVTFFDPQSTLAETYRTLRTNIEFVTVEKEVREMMVTSSSFQEGKSTVVANLAMSIAQLGKRTLLIDADLRKPTLARMFGLDREPGLTEVIIGNHQWREVVRTLTDIVTGGMGLADILQTQGISNLHIITSGSIPPNPAELLNSQRTSELIEEVRDVYDMVLFDTPPVLQVTDAAILGKKVKGTLMVYKAGDIPRTSLKRSSDLLRGMDIDLLGVVLNGISAEMGSDYDDFGYGSYYSYGVEETSPGTGLAARLQSYVHGWRNRNGDGAAQQATEGRPDDERGTRKRRTSLLSYLVLGLTGLGLVWQSGYLQKPFGAIPILEWYETTRGDGERAEETAAEREVVEAPIGLSDDQTEPLATGREVTLASGSAVTVARQAEEVSSGVPPAETEGSAVPNQVREETTEGSRSLYPYAIRTAAYGPANAWAERSLRRLRQHGEVAFLSPVVVKGKTLERLLVGHFASWDAAYRHAQQLRADGQIEEFAVLRLPYTVELQTFANRHEADRLADSLGGQTHFAYVQQLTDGTFRLLAGAFATVAEARKLTNLTQTATSSGKVAVR